MGERLEFGGGLAGEFAEVLDLGEDGGWRADVSGCEVEGDGEVRLGDGDRDESGGGGAVALRGV